MLKRGIQISIQTSQQCKPPPSVWFSATTANFMQAPFIPLGVLSLALAGTATGHDNHTGQIRRDSGTDEHTGQLRWGFCNSNDMQNNKYCKITLSWKIKNRVESECFPRERFSMDGSTALRQVNVPVRYKCFWQSYISRVQLLATGCRYLQNLSPFAFLTSPLFSAYGKERDTQGYEMKCKKETVCSNFYFQQRKVIIALIVRDTKLLLSEKELERA